MKINKLLLLIITQIGYCQNPIFMGDTLKGKVKTIKFKSEKLNISENDNHYHANIDFNYEIYDNGKSEVFNYRYDENGNNIFAQNFKKHSIEKKYDNNNKLIEELTYILDSNGFKISLGKITYKYGENLMIAKSYRYLNREECLYNIKTLNYDDRHNIIKQFSQSYSCNSYGSHSLNTITNTYNLINQKVNTLYSNSENDNITNIQFIYKNKKLYKEITFNNNSKRIASQKIIIYNIDNTKKSISYYLGENTLDMKEVFTFDKNNRLIDEKQFINGESKLIRHRTYLYKEDKLIEITNDEMWIEKFYKKIITYDFEGNIIESIYLDKDNIPKRKNEIQIEYFKK